MDANLFKRQNGKEENKMSKRKTNIIKTDEAISDFARFLLEREELQKRIKIDDGYISINIVCPYEFELVRCDTHEKLVKWIYHLAEKNWVTTDVLRVFIETVAGQFGWDIYGA